MDKLKTNNKSGITLIALVVTIIVLLLLAGISIQMLSGDNGILPRAGQAKEMTDIAQVEEEARLIYMESMIDYNTKQGALENLDTICTKLNSQGYQTKIDTLGNEVINGIKTTPATLDTAPTSSTADTLTFANTATSADTQTITVVKDLQANSSAKYYAVINGKDYEMTLSNGTINISRTATSGADNTGATLTLKSVTAIPENIVDIALNGNVITLTKDENATSGIATITIVGTINGTDYTKYAKVSIKSYASKVGYYADLNGDNQITLEEDGIIFADLAVGASGTGLGQSYELDAVTSGLKQYEESETSFSGTDAKFGEQKWIKAVDGTTGKNRFYVMALKDIDINYHFWFYNAYSLINSATDKAPYYITEDGIGIDANNKAVGRKNTEAIMAKFKSTTEGGWGKAVTGQIYTDMLKVIGTKYNSSIGWFVPSKQELTAFAGFLSGKGLTTSNYNSTFGLSDRYWLSSQLSLNTPQYAWRANFSTSNFSNGPIYNVYFVRLCTVF